jgi:hypothetical protein
MPTSGGQRDAGKTSRFASRGRQAGKTARRSSSWRCRGGQRCRGICARKIGVLGNATRPAVSTRPPRNLAPRRFSCDRIGPSLRLAARDLFPPSLESRLAARDARAPGESRQRAIGPDMRKRQTANRVRKRSGHAAAVSTTALWLAVSRADCWLSAGQPQAACVSTAQALKDTVAMPAVRARGRDLPGAISPRRVSSMTAIGVPTLGSRSGTSSRRLPDRLTPDVCV